MRNFVRKLSLILLTVMLSQIAVPLFTYASGTSPVIIEAESFAVTDSHNFKKVADDNASGGYVLKSYVANTSSTPLYSQAGYIEYSFTVSASGYYNIWVRSQSKTTGSDSVYYAGAGSESYVYKEFAVNDAYLWTKIQKSYLNSGTNKIRLYSREGNVTNGFCLDKILITESGAYVPTGVDGADNPIDKNLSSPYGKPKVYPPENTHPRVLVNEEILTTVKKNLTNAQNSDMNAKVESYAKYAKDNKNTGTLASGSTNNYSETELAIIESCAFMYLTKKTDYLTYGEKSVTNIKNFLNTLVLTTNRFATRSAGHTIYITALVYDWCYDLLDDTEKEELIGHIVNLATTMEIGWPAIKQGNFVGHGSESQLLKDLFAAAVAIYDEYPEFYELVGGRLYNEMIPARDFMYDGHYFQIGSGYGPYRYTADMWNAFLLKAIGDTTSYSPDQKYMMYEMIYNRRPDGIKAVHGDYYDIFDGYSTADLGAFFLASNYYKDEMLKKEYYRINPSGQNYYSSNLSISPVLHLIVNDVTVGAQSFENLPLTSLYEGSNGVMIARSSWDEGKDSDTVLVRMNFINKLIGSHQHLDSGSFDIYYKGGLAIDSGVYESQSWKHEDGTTEINLAYGSEHDMNYHKLSVAHNVMLVKMPGEQLGFTDTYVNDGGQMGPKGLGEPNTTLTNLKDLEKENINIGTILSRDIGDNLNKPDYSYIKGDITKAYSDAKMDKYIRSFMYLNFFDEDYPAALIVFDDIKSKNKDYEKSWILHTEEEPIVNETTNEILVSRTEKGYTGSMVNKTLLPLNSDTKYTVIGGAGKEFYVDGKNFTAIPESGYEAGKYRVEITTKSKNEQDYYLNVIEIGKNGEKYPASAELIANDNNFAGVKVKDRVVFFKKGNEKQTGEFEINLETNDEDLKYIVTGLKEGKWTVTSNGNLICEKEVSEKSDVLTFSAKDGSYKLSYENADVENKDLFFMNNKSESLGNIPSIKFGKEMVTFKNPPVVTEKGMLLVCAEEYLEKIGITPYILNENKVAYKFDLKDVTFENGKKTFNVNGADIPLTDNIRAYNGKLYIPPFEAEGQLGTTATYNSIGRVMASTNGISYKVTPKNIVTVNKNEGGNVLPGGIILVTDNEPADITITPDNGYYVEEVLFNGTPYGVYSQLGVVTLRTPEIKENSELTVKFAKISEAKTPDIETVPYIAKDDNGIFLMGRINAQGFDVSEYGVLYSTFNPEPTYDGFNVKKVPSKYPCSNAGYYGFTFVNPKNYENIYVRAYAKYNDGNIVLADKTINLGDFEIKDLTPVYNNKTPVLTDDTYVDKSKPDDNYNFMYGTDERTPHNLMLPGKFNPNYGRMLYLEFDISGIEGVSGGADLVLYVKQPNATAAKIIKYLSIYELEEEFDETELTYNNAEKFGKCIGTLKTPESTILKPLKFDITDYLKKRLNEGKDYISIGVGINEEWQKQLYPNGTSDFNLNIQSKARNEKAEIILY